MSDDLNLTDSLTTVSDAALNLGGDDGGHPGLDELITTIYIPIPPGDDLADPDDESGLEQLPPGTYTPTLVNTGVQSGQSVVRVSNPQNTPSHEKVSCPGINKISITAVSGVMSVFIYNGNKCKAEMTIVAPGAGTVTKLKYEDCFTHYKVVGHADARHTAVGAISGHPFKWE